MSTRIRRVVMGEPSPGMSVFTDVSEVEPVPLGPTTRRYYVWGCDELPQYPYHETEPYVPRSHFPPPGGVRVFVEQSFGVQAAESEAEKQGQEKARQLSAAEPNGMRAGTKPGMHQTNGFDVGIVISGEITVTAEDGTSHVMGPGDIYIQPGAMHQWHTDPENPAVMAFVVVQRDDPRPQA